MRYEALDVDGGTATIAYIAAGGRGSKKSDELFVNELEELHLQQLVTFPTYQDSDRDAATNTLDLIITDDPARVYAIEADAPLGRTPMGRHHVMLKWCIATAGSAKMSSSKPVTTRHVRGTYQKQPRP